MRHFFLDHLKEKGYILDPVDIHHMSRVLRMKVGDELSAAYQGQVFHGRIGLMDKRHIEIEILNTLPPQNYPKIHLYQGLAKGQKIEEILQHGTELGISRFGLVPTRYSDVKNVENRKERYERILKDAAKQSRSPILPELVFYSKLCELPFHEDEIFFCYEGEREKRIALEKKGSVGLIIGPEGGFSEEEACFLMKKAQSVSLGQRILRTETAGLVATSVLLREFGVL